MVDPIGTAKAAGRDLSVARVAPVPPAKTSNGTTGTTDTAALTGVSQALSASPPVDTDRVAKVKKAIADGKFPILPTTIADRLIAYKLEWMQNDPA